MVDRTARSRALLEGRVGSMLPSRSALAALRSRSTREALRGSARLSEQSERRLLELMLRFLRYVERGCGVESLRDVTAEHVRGFVLAPSGGRKPSAAECGDLAPAPFGGPVVVPGAASGVGG